MATTYRAEVIGSMLRPEYLKQARKRWEAKGISTREFKEIEDRAVDEMIVLQEKCGVDVVTDGEMRRTHFIAPLTDVITGVKPIPAFTRVWRRPPRARSGGRANRHPSAVRGGREDRADALAHQ
jgi:5-methyltetrahydropteroyltriglutamate--homocysteine methyltransferase